MVFHKSKYSFFVHLNWLQLAILYDFWRESSPSPGLIPGERLRIIFLHYCQIKYPSGAITQICTHTFLDWYTIYSLYFSTVATLTAIVAIPALYNYMQHVQSSLQTEVCVSRKVKEGLWFRLPFVRLNSLQITFSTFLNQPFFALSSWRSCFKRPENHYFCKNKPSYIQCKNTSFQILTLF